MNRRLAGAGVGLVLAVVGLAAVAGRDDEEAGDAATLGIATSPVDETTARQLGLTPGIGLAVASIEPDSPAADVLRPHDILTRLDDQWLVSEQQLAVLARRRAPGDVSRMTIVRGGRVSVRTVTWGQASASPDLSPAPPPVAGPGSLDERIAEAEQRRGPRFGGRLPPPRDLPSLSDFARAFQDIMDAIRVDVNALVDTESGALAPPPPADAGRSSVQLWDLDQLTVTLTQSEEGRRLTATTPAGETILEGPIDTAEQRRRLPDPLADLLDRLQAENPAAFPW